MNNTRRLKLIAGALELDRKSIAQAVTTGGIETSNSRADGWLRATDAQKSATGNARGGADQYRARDMTDPEFDAFCLGLRHVLDALDHE